MSVKSYFSFWCHQQHFLGLLFGIVFSMQTLATTSSALPQTYQQMLELDSAHLVLPSPDQKWQLVSGGNPVGYHIPASENAIFNAAGKKLYKSLPLSTDNYVFNNIHLIHNDQNTSEPRHIPLPEGLLVDMVWSPDSEKIALAIANNNQIRLWRYLVKQQKLLRWSDISLGASLEENIIYWLPDSERVLVTQAVKKGVESPGQSDAFHTNALSSTGVVIKDAGITPKSRIYRNAIDNPQSASNTLKFGQRQLALVEKGGQYHTVVPPALIEHFEVSPSGRYALFREISRNFHHSMKFSRLARCNHVVDLLSMERVYSLTCQSAAVLASKIKDSAPTGARLTAWLPNKAHTLVWVEALDNGDSRNAVTHREQIAQLPAPFNTNPEVLHQTNWRIYQLYSTENGRIFFTDWEATNKQIRLWSWLPQSKSSQPPSKPSLLIQYNYTDKYQDPGDIMRFRTPLGTVVATSNESNHLFLTGAGLTSMGRQAFVDSWDTENVKSRLFLSDKTRQQTPVKVLAKKVDSPVILFKELTKGVIPSLYSIAVPPKESNNAIQPGFRNAANSTQFYSWPAFDSQPAIEHRHLSFKREDGVKMLSDLYLPERKTDKKLPVLIWLYPREYKSGAEQQRRSANNGHVPIYPLSPLVALLEGVAVVDASGIPIATLPNSKPNDSFIEQQTMNAKAIIKTLQETGEIDTNRAIIMGHSYGAFSVVSMLANTDLFKAGIARSGAYNRTLTPLGFQGEKRTLWQEPELYQRLSPLFQADKIKEPLLIVHGKQDNNPGTDPMQSELLFEAIQANGGKARLVLLPNEGHQYQTLEGIKVLLEEQRNWIQQWLF